MLDIIKSIESELIFLRDRKRKCSTSSDLYFSYRTKIEHLETMVWSLIKLYDSERIHRIYDDSSASSSPSVLSPRHKFVTCTIESDKGNTSP